MLLCAVLLAGCQGGEQLNKWSSAPSPTANPAMAGQADPNPELKCLSKCREKAVEAGRRCEAENGGAACQEKFTEERIQCETKCLPP